MFCKYCGKEIDNRAAVCIHCGIPTDVLTPYEPMPNNRQIDPFSEFSVKKDVDVKSVQLDKSSDNLNNSIEADNGVIRADENKADIPQHIYKSRYADYSAENVNSADNTKNMSNTAVVTNAPSMQQNAQFAPPVQPVKKKTNGMCIAGFVIGICSILFYYTWCLAVVGLVLSILGVVEAKKQQQPKGLGIAGIVINSIVVALIVIVVFVFIFYFWLLMIFA